MAKGEERGQPGAANMRRMVTRHTVNCHLDPVPAVQVWNTELEAIAQRWADQCGWAGSAHDKNRNKLDGTIVNI